jgi:predicted protein tyrosine phosphatase
MDSPVQLPDSAAPFQFAVCGIEELGGYCKVGVSHVLSILDPVFPDPPAFAAFSAHRRLALRFHDVIGERHGMVAPCIDDVDRLLAFGREMTAEPELTPYLLVHCHAGISRSTAAMYLLLAQARPELPATEVLAAVRGIRPAAWPNMLLVEFGDELLGRQGELVEALRSHYRAALRRDPAFGALMLASGRSREVLHAG